MLGAHESGAGATVAGIRAPGEATAFGVIELMARPAASPVSGRSPTRRPPRRPHDSLASMGNYVFTTEVQRQSGRRRDETRHDIGGDIIPKLVDKGLATVTTSPERVPG